MDNFIICVIKDPGEQPIVANIPNTGEALQKAVGGYYETLTITSDLALLRNTDGFFMGLPRNHTVYGRPLFGSVVVTGVDRDGCVASLTPDQIRDVMRLLREPESDLRGGDK